MFFITRVYCTCVQEARSIALVKQESLSHFSRPSPNVSSTTFQNPELIIQCGFIWKETMQLVSGNLEFNACQVALLWHNSLVSLRTFQPTLAYMFYIYSQLCLSSLTALWTNLNIHVSHGHHAHIQSSCAWTTNEEVHEDTFTHSNVKNLYARHNNAKRCLK